MEITAIVPIRAHSKGLPGKNTRELAGKPLFMHAVDCAHAAGIADVVVASDDPVLLSGDPAGYRLFARSDHSARDSAPTHEVLIEAIEALDLHAHLIVLLQATSPLRRPQTVRATVDLMQDSAVQLGCTVSPMDPALLKSGTVKNGYLEPVVDTATLFTPRQALPPVYKMDGGVYAFWGQWLVQNGSLETTHIKVVESQTNEVLDIDDLTDFEQAQRLLTPQA